jgi:hypothetical protein
MKMTCGILLLLGVAASGGTPNERRSAPAPEAALIGLTLGGCALKEAYILLSFIAP